MTGKARLKLVADAPALEFGHDGAIRQAVGENGRLHVDRSLFFLVLHRGDAQEDSLARHIAIHSSAYLIWDPADDEAAMSALDGVIEAMLGKYENVLLLSLYDQPRPEPARDDATHLPAFTAWVGAGDDALGTGTAKVLGDALANIEIDLRHCVPEHRSRPFFEPGIEERVDRQPRLAHVSLGLPWIHDAPDGGRYPQLFRELSVRAGDAVLRAACAFADLSDQNPPAHYRSLGRSAFLAAALAADRKLSAIADSFDFLLSVSPINTSEAQAQFLADRGRRPPKFRYRPLEIDPDEAKRRLYAVDLGQIEDPLLESLFAEKRREIEQQLTMLATRNTADFRAASMLQYGPVEPQLLAEAEAILASARPAKACPEILGASEVARAARALIQAYKTADKGFDAKIELRDDLAAGLMVSGGTLMISTHSRMPAHRVDALLAHEVSVHLLTYFNGAAQGLDMFRTGLAQYEGVQEGLGVFAEWAVGGLTAARLRLLAGRVVAVESMLSGADFIETFDRLRDRGFSKGTAFSISSRVHRSGGFAKDAIYLRGFKAVCDLVADGVPLDAFWLGKIAPQHLPAVQELLQRGLLRPPRHGPEFLDRDDARARITGLARSRSLATLLQE